MWLLPDVRTRRASGRTVDRADTLLPAAVYAVVGSDMDRQRHDDYCDVMSDTAQDPNPQDALNALTPEARAAYELTGEFPQAETPAPEPEPEPDDPEPEPEPAAEAVPVVPERKISKRQEHLNTLERKAAEAEAKAADLAARLAAVEARTKPVEEPKPDPKDEFQPTRPKPTEAEFETYAEFVDALADWKLDQRDAKAAFEADKKQRAEAETSQRESFRERRNAWAGRRDAFTAKHPDKAERVLTFLDHVTADTPIGDTIMDSEVGAEIADYLSEHKAESERIARLDPVSALRALGKLEAQFEPTHASAPAQPAAKTVTTAPAIPHTLAARSASPADPVRAAVEAGDYSAFEAEMNRQLA